MVYLPKAEYAKLFETLNGAPYASFAADLDGYPKLDGIPVPLARMRSVVRDLPVPAIDAHLGEPVDRFSEQERKAKLVLAPAARTYGDWSAGIELRYGNGYRLVLADARLAGLSARSAKRATRPTCCT
jgi:hypothetical protein